MSLPEPPDSSFEENQKVDDLDSSAARLRQVVRHCLVQSCPCKFGECQAEAEFVRFEALDGELCSDLCVAKEVIMNRIERMQMLSVEKTDSSVGNILAMANAEAAKADLDEDRFGFGTRQA